jgi:hypothetical protein
MFIDLIITPVFVQSKYYGDSPSFTVTMYDHNGIHGILNNKLYYEVISSSELMFGTRQQNKK